MADTSINIPSAWQRPPVKLLNTEHADYKSMKDEWYQLNVLYQGCSVMRRVATEFLYRRPRELQEIYETRIKHFSYQNILSTGLGYYRAALFKNNPSIIGNLIDNKGQKSDKNFPNDLEAFYVQFRKNCDRQGTSFIDFFRDFFTNLAVFKSTYVLIDMPKSGLGPDASLKDQKAAGLLDAFGKPSPYLVSYTPLNIINWGNDDLGNLQWALISVMEVRTEFLGEASVFDVWYYFDQEKFLKYERQRKPSEINGIDNIDKDAVADLVDAGPHCLAKQKRVPLLRFEVPSSLWLGARVKDPAMDHLNSDNSYSWALRQSCLAMPVITSDQEIKPTLSEAGFIRLPSGSTYQWSEPSGRSFERMEMRVKELREEIFRLMYLQAQGRTSTASAAAASAVSKEADMMPAQEVMNEYGDVVRASMQFTLDTVALAREDDNVCFDVRGMKFGKTSTIMDIQKTEAILALEIPSDTFQKEVFKQASTDFLPDMNDETFETISDEIDKAPTQTEMQEKERQDTLNQYQSKITSAVGRFNKPRVPNPNKPSTE